MADTFYRFHHTAEQQRRYGARGGKTTARNRRVCSLGASAPSTGDRVAAGELHVETTARAIAALDIQFPWLRGAERRLPAKSSRRKTHRTRALTAEREKPMQESIPGGITLMGLPLPPDVQTPPDSGCVNCGSSHIEPFESYGPTGVRAPDGGAEYSSDEGIHCRDCGANEPEAETREWLREAFQIVIGRSRIAPQREHLVAMTLHFRELVSALFAVRTPKEVN
jgi:hypothetical protein